MLSRFVNHRVGQATAEVVNINKNKWLDGEIFVGQVSMLRTRGIVQFYASWYKSYTNMKILGCVTS
jgi:hypothetical protein